MTDRRDLWFDRAKEERNDLDRETTMLKEAIQIFRDHPDLANIGNTAVPGTPSGNYTNSILCGIEAILHVNDITGIWCILKYRTDTSYLTVLGGNFG